MANELTLGLGVFSFNKQNRSYSKPGGDMPVNVTGLHFSAGTKTIGTSEESLPLGEVTTVGWFRLENMSETNFVTYGTVTGHLDLKLKPRERVIVRANANAVIVKADTADCDVEFCIVSD